MSHWKAVATAAVLMLMVMSLAVLAQEKKSKPAPGKAPEQAMSGCGMKGEMGKAEAGKGGEMPGCGMKGGMGMGVGMPGCGMKGEMGKGMACCCCGMKGGMGAGMHGCGMKGGMGGGMPGCSMKGGMGGGMAGCGPMGRMGMRAEGGPMGGPGMGSGMDGGHVAMVLHALDLTADQQKKVATIHERMQRQMIQQQADLRIAMLDLRQLVHAATPDQAKIEAQIDRIAGVRVGMAKAHIATLLEVRSLLTPEQLKKWQALPMEGLGGDED
jgi:Spy/CpxP family protein refolding chaperone